MKRVVITGVGIVSSIGNNKDKVLDSLLTNTSGINYIPEYAESGLRAQIAGDIKLNIEEHLDRKQLRTMANVAGYAHIALEEAITDAELTEDMIHSPRTGVIAGSGSSSTTELINNTNLFREKGIRRVSPFHCVRTMGSTVSANLSTSFGIKGVSYSISSACATGTHSIGAAMEQIQWGKQDIVFAGGSEDVEATITMYFDAMKALSTKYNDTPAKASRPFDKNRDGFVISGGAGMLVLEEYEHAIQRGAKIYAELVGYAATSNGANLTAPGGDGEERCMQQALEQAGNPDLDYINAHATSTPVGDSCELKAIKNVFKKQQIPIISSTKSLTGHSLAASGAHEAIYSLLMMNNNFITANGNIEEPDSEAIGLPIITENMDARINYLMSNSFGFGGTNASLIFKKHSH